jgi:hypothetical protein
MCVYIYIYIYVYIYLLSIEAYVVIHCNLFVMHLLIYVSRLIDAFLVSEVTRPVNRMKQRVSLLHEKET